MKKSANNTASLDKCPICEVQAKVTEFDAKERLRVKCPGCGKFVITATALAVARRNHIVGDLWRSILSYWVWNRQNLRGKIEIDRNLLELVLKEIELPNHRVQAENLIRWLGQNQQSPEQFISENPRIIATRIGANDDKGVAFIKKYLADNNLIEFYKLTSRQTGDVGIDMNKMRLSFTGWDKFDEIKHSGTSGKVAFMAMQYNDPIHDSVYKKCFKPAVKETGFKLRRLDEYLPAGLIDNQLRVEILNSRFLLADLTNDNLGAYWEAGYAEGLGKPVIYLCETKHFDKFKTHFDTNHHTTIKWDIDDLEEAARQLKNTIRATLPLEAKMVDADKGN